MIPVPNFNKRDANSNFLFKNIVFCFHFYSKNAFSERNLSLNTLELYLLEKHVFRPNNRTILSMALTQELSLKSGLL